jgi:hypothetical protein
MYVSHKTCHLWCLQVPVVPGEQVPDGVRRIEAVTSAGIADMTAGVEVVVGVMDSGVVSAATSNMHWLVQQT